MAMAQDEFNANLRVQGLKTLVNEARAAVEAGTLATLSSKKLGELTAALGNSIRSRKSLTTLGTSRKKHPERILQEERWHAALLAESHRRALAGAADRLQTENAQMKKATLLPSGAGWGGPRSGGTGGTS